MHFYSPCQKNAVTCHSDLDLSISPYDLGTHTACRWVWIRDKHYQHSRHPFASIDQRVPKSIYSWISLCQDPRYDRLSWDHTTTSPLLGQGMAWDNCQGSGPDGRFESDRHFFFFNFIAFSPGVSTEGLRFFPELVLSGGMISALRCALWSPTCNLRFLYVLFNLIRRLMVFMT